MDQASEAEIRKRLAALGRRRRAMDYAGKGLHDEITKALREADGVVSKAEAARLLGMQRSTLYRVYG